MSFDCSAPLDGQATAAFIAGECPSPLVVFPVEEARQARRLNIGRIEHRNIPGASRDVRSRIYVTDEMQEEEMKSVLLFSHVGRLQKDFSIS